MTAGHVMLQLMRLKDYLQGSEYIKIHFLNIIDLDQSIKAEHEDSVTILGM